jgi:hypothetical protein
MDFTESTHFALPLLLRILALVRLRRKESVRAGYQLTLLNELNFPLQRVTA